MKFLKSKIVLALALAITGTASAGTNSTPFNVSADVIKECAIDGGNLVFADTGLLLQNVDATANIQIECTGALPYTLKNNGSYQTSWARSPTGKAFALVNGTSNVGFVLYSDATHTTAFAETATIAGTSAGGVQQIPVYGRIFPQDGKPAGAYTAVLPLTLTF